MYSKTIFMSLLTLLAVSACSKSNSGNPSKPVESGGLSSTITLMAGSETLRGDADNADPLLARFDHPTALALDGNTLWVADGYDASSVRKIELPIGKVSTVIPWNNFDGYGQRRNIYNLKINPVTHTLFIITREEELWQYDPVTGKRTMIISSVDARGVTKDEYNAVQVGSLVSASVAEAYGLAVSPEGNYIFVSDNVRGVIKKIDLNNKGNEVSVFAGKPYALAHDISAYPFTDGASMSATFSDVQDLAMTPNNELLVADYGWSCIRKINADQVSSLTGHNPGVSISGTNKDGPLADARINRPQHLSFCNAGIYFTDYGGVRLLRPGQDVQTLRPDYSGVHRSGANSVAVEASADGGTVYESQGNAIYKYTVKLN